MKEKIKLLPKLSAVIMYPSLRSHFLLQPAALIVVCTQISFVMMDYQPHFMCAHFQSDLQIKQFVGLPTTCLMIRWQVVDLWVSSCSKTLLLYSVQTWPYHIVTVVLSQWWIFSSSTFAATFDPASHLFAIYFRAIILHIQLDQNLGRSCGWTLHFQ